MGDSPYLNLEVDQWEQRTKALLAKHPLKAAEIVEIVLLSWGEIFKSRIGSKGFRIGEDIYPQPQIMAFLLHELVALELAARYPKVWRRDASGADKDLVYVPDETFSIEIKTSSSAHGVFGNRSYAQPTQSDKKSKSGYYLAVNFAAFLEDSKEQPEINRIRFGWLDHSDWRGQVAASGQAATPTGEAKKHKLITLYCRTKKGDL